MNWLYDLIAVFRQPSAEMMAIRQLEEAKRQLLNALSAKEYATAMVDYQTAQVTRLTATVKGL